MDAPYTVTRHSSLRVVAEESPEASELLAEYGLSCANCFEDELDSVQNAAKKHTMSESDMLSMLAEINSYLKEAYEAAQH